jgi:hypothetical protein
MQLITFLSTAAIVATAAARNAVTLNKECNADKAFARVINRCDYPVYLWSVYKGDGCPEGDMVTLKTGEVYNENYEDANGGETGVSIKISKEQQCKGNDIVQLEYYLEKRLPGFNYNYLDVSYVDCLGGDCPTKNEGYYLVAGNQTGGAAASAGNTWCPILSCHDAVSCAKCSYILPDDVQTKTCDHDSSMDFYMCGGDAPTSDYGSTPAPASSSKKVESSEPAPTSTQDDSYNVKAAAVTAAAEIKDVEVQAQKIKTKVEVVYVTAYEYVHAKRHAHGHARRHQQFHA